MTGEWKRAAIGALVGMAAMGVAGWVTRGNDSSTDSVIRITKLEMIVQANAIAITGLIAHVDQMTQGQSQIFTNAKNIGELTSEVREILKAVTRLEVLNETKAR